MRKKREEKQAKKSVFPFFPFLRYGKKFHQLWANPVEIEIFLSTLQNNLIVFTVEIERVTQPPNGSSFSRFSFFACFRCHEKKFSFFHIAFFHHLRQITHHPCFSSHFFTVLYALIYIHTKLWPPQLHLIEISFTHCILIAS